MSFINLTSKDKCELLETAKNSITYGMQQQCFLPVELGTFSELLQTQGASFVTLHLNNKLRGCIGTLQACQPLITDVSSHAYAAAFEDPRFNHVTEHEIEQLKISISILTTAKSIHFVSESDLLKQLQPETDGIILEAGNHKATFLPSVWEQLPTASIFLTHLKEKAGLNKNDWPDNIKFFRYETINI